MGKRRTNYNYGYPYGGYPYGLEGYTGGMYNQYRGGGMMYDRMRDWGRSSYIIWRDRQFHHVNYRG